MKNFNNSRKNTKFFIVFCVIVAMPIILFLLKVPNLPDHKWDFSLSFSTFIMSTIIILLVLYFRKDINGLKLNGLNVFGADFKIPSSKEELQEITQQNNLEIEMESRK